MSSFDCKRIANRTGKKVQFSCTVLCHLVSHMRVSRSLLYLFLFFPFDSSFSLSLSVCPRKLLKSNHCNVHCAQWTHTVIHFRFASHPYSSKCSHPKIIIVFTDFLRGKWNETGFWVSVSCNLALNLIISMIFGFSFVF